MKKILLIASLFACLSAFGDGIISTNVTGTNGVYLLLSGRANIYQVELTSDKSAYVELFDASSVAAPYYGTNYVIETNLVTKSTYATNLVTSFVGNNGYTNWYTNAGIWTLTATNASKQTNALSPVWAGVVAPNTYAVYTSEALFTKGVVMRFNTNVSAVMNYRTSQ